MRSTGDRLQRFSCFLKCSRRYPYDKGLVCSWSTNAFWRKKFYLAGAMFVEKLLLYYYHWGGCFYGLESFYNAAALTAISSVDTARPSDQIQRRTGM